MAASKPDIKAVLVKVGGGQWLTFAHDNVQKLDASALLKALKRDEVFSVKLRDVALDDCIVSVFASASKKELSDAEASVKRKLEGAETLDEVVGPMITAELPYLYIHVELPAKGECGTTADAGSS